MGKLINLYKSFIPILIVLILLLSFILYLEQLAEAYSTAPEIVKVSSGIYEEEVWEIEKDMNIRSKFYEKFQMDSTFNKAIRFYDKKQYKQAIEQFTSLLHGYGDHPYIQFYIGLSHFKLINLQEAIDWLTKAGKTNRRFPSIYVYKALVYKKQKQYDLALSSLQRALQIKKDYFYGAYQLASSFLFNKK